jgi:hypothetical protein
MDQAIQIDNEIIPPNNNDNANNTSRGTSLSPINVPVLNSNVNTPNSIVSENGESLRNNSQLNINTPVLGIEEVIEKFNNKTIINEDNHNNDMMNIDDNSMKTKMINNNSNNKNVILSNVKVSKDDLKEITEDKEKLRKERINQIEESLDIMENTRLELVPLLLDIIEQVKNGELSIKDADNACGRIRVRINRLYEDRKVVKTILENLNQEFSCNDLEKRQILEKIQKKEDCLESLVTKISQRFV